MAQIVLQRADRTPLRRLVRAAYFAVARTAGAYLARGEPSPAIYVRAGLGAGEFVPGRSDIDLAIVVPASGTTPGISSDRVWRRWERLADRLPRTGLLLEQPRVYDELELRDVVGSSAMTYGLQPDNEDRAALLTRVGNVGRSRILFRPGLYGATSDWRLISGPERRPVAPPRSAQEQRIAAWLELSYWWRWAFHASADPHDPAVPRLSIKLVAEAARIWLWLACQERYATRGDVLRRALQQLPEEERAIRIALALQSNQRVERPLSQVLPALLRLSTRVARLLADETAAAGSTPVRLVGDTRAGSTGALALCDWQALVSPPFPSERFTVQDGDPADPRLLGAATRAQSGGSYQAMRGPSLLVLPARFSERSRGRALKSEVTDPVSLALAAGSSVALFRNVLGWSAEDTARRAVAEHRGWLRGPLTPLPMWMLLSAARAGLFLASIREGDPQLAPTLRGAAEQLATRFPDADVAHAVRSNAVEGVRALVLQLPG